METLADLRNRDNPMCLDRARTVATVASVLVDSARAENDYLKITHQDHSPFMEPVDEGLQRLENKGEPTAHNPFPRVVRHTLEG
ncbi:MAG: hypothetical protein KAX88_03190 [Rhodoferax sp.]|nr:hypothetical protein [Rhodoferax sp.]